MSCPVLQERLFGMPEKALPPDERARSAQSNTLFRAPGKAKWKNGKARTACEHV